MPEYNVEIRLTDSAVLERAVEAIDNLAWKLDKPADGEPPLWRFWFDGEPSTAAVEQVLDEIDYDWRGYLLVGIGVAEAGS